MSVLTINLPETISDKLNIVAGTNKSEIEKFVLIALAEKLDYIDERAKRANIDEFEGILAKIPNVKAESFDTL
jgi:hypothetical protein